MKKIISQLNRFFCLNRLVNTLYCIVFYLVFYQFFLSQGKNGWFVFLMLAPFALTALVMRAVVRAGFYSYEIDEALQPLIKKMKPRLQRLLRKKS